MRTQRQLKVGEEIRHALAMLFQRGDVPWPHNFQEPILTVSEVQISPDLRNATAFFTTIDGKRGSETARVLNGISGFFRTEVAKSVRLGYVPKLDFKLDTSFDYASKIEQILKAPEVIKDLVEKIESEQGGGGEVR